MSIPIRMRGITGRVRQFHADEAGESSTLSNVMMLAIAAIIVIALIAFGKTAYGWLKQKWNEMAGTSIK